MEKLAERLYDNQKAAIGFGNAGAETNILNSATQVLSDVDRIKNRRSLIARKSLIKQMDQPGETAEEKRERIRKMNEEAEQMGQEAELVMAELQALRNNKNEHWYEDVLRRDYQENLYDEKG